MNINQIVRIGSYLLMAIGAIMLVMVFMNGEQAVGPFLSFGNALTIITVIVAVVFSFLNIFKNAKQARNTLIGLGVLVVVMLLAYSISSGADFESFKGFEVTEGKSKMVSAGLNTFYIFFFLAVGSVLFAEIGKIFK
jgi:hypothetical protein